MKRIFTKTKYANRFDVQYAAESLIEKFGAISVLEVWEKLRGEGLLAFQEDVSRVMKKLAYEKDWDWEFNGRFRFYFLPDEKTMQSKMQFVFSMN